VKVAGLHAVRALAERRRRDIVRVYLVEARISDFGPLLKWCAENKKAYHVVDEEELERIAESIHHEGVCVLAKAKPRLRFGDLAGELEKARGFSSLVYLDGVKNPHNLGAILRVAAHFGVRAILLPARGGRSRMTAAIQRTAEGGAESVDVVEVDPPIRALETLRRLGFAIYGTSGRGATSLYEARPSRRSIFLLGAEGEGLSGEMLRTCDDVLMIPGTGEVESLNVACAAAVVLGEHWRIHKANRR
jgi:RNA methyltransferase, TrmH family